MDTSQCASSRDFAALCLTIVPFLAITIASYMVHINRQSEIIHKLGILIQELVPNPR